MAFFKPSGIAILLYDSRMRLETAFHHSANAARGGSQLDAGSNDGSINDAVSAKNFTLDTGWMSTPWYSGGRRNATARSSTGAEIESPSRAVGCVLETEAGNRQEAGRAGTGELAIRVFE
jgi:hypothetical protein